MLKKNILCLVMAAVMTFGTATTAKAEEITSSKDWTVDFKNDKLNSNFTSKEIAEEVYGMLPGDTMKIGVKIKNSESIQTDWYMSNEILKSLEDYSQAENGAYTYKLSYKDVSGKETVLYDSDTVGGEDKKSGEEGLHQATNSMEDYFYLDRLDKNETGTVELEVGLEGETQGNAYQNTLAKLQLNFAVEKVSKKTKVEKGKNKVVKKTMTGKSSTIRKTAVTSPKTGDTMHALLFSAIALVSGIVVLIIAVLAVKRRREDEKGE